MHNQLANNVSLPDPQHCKLVLASQSARRLELLQQIGINPVCLPVDVDETPELRESATDLVKRLARLKAHSCCASEACSVMQVTEKSYFVLGADTVIDLEGQILGKPEDEEHAVDMLHNLSGREHQVHTGVCLLEGSQTCQETIVVSTCVRFCKIDAAKIRRYVSTGEAFGKAGAYAVQGLGAQFVECLSGSYSNVVGLPLFETSEMLERAGYPTL